VVADDGDALSTQISRRRGEQLAVGRVMAVVHERDCRTGAAGELHRSNVGGDARLHVRIAHVLQPCVARREPQQRGKGAIRGVRTCRRDDPVSVGSALSVQRHNREVGTRLERELNGDRARKVDRHRDLGAREPHAERTVAERRVRQSRQQILRRHQ